MAAMCDAPPSAADRVGRRSFLLGSVGALVGVPVLGSAVTTAWAQETVAPDLAIVPRSAWGGDLTPTGPLSAEAAGDVRFLLVHHTVSPNDYGADETVGLLRGIFGYHTGEKAWPDVAYNFFVDRFGQVFEGRTGSLTSPVKPDATGGSQGFAQLGCFVGDHTVEPPTLAATTSMIRLLAWLADTYGIDTAPGATTTFVSRGSNLHPAGTTVTTATIAGHRDMSQTTCPGDGVYPAVRERFPEAVTARRAEVAAGATTTVPASTVPPTTLPVTTAAGSTPTTSGEAAAPAAAEVSDGGGRPWWPAAVVGGVVAGAAGAVSLRRRRAADGG